MNKKTLSLELKKKLVIAALLLLCVWPLRKIVTSLYIIVKNPMKYLLNISNLGGLGVIIFIILGLLQSIVFLIPGEIFDISAGYIYGVFWGTVISLIGISIGGSIIFFTARKFELKWLVKPIEKKLDKDLLGSIEKINEMDIKNKWALIFLVYLTPVLPKEIVTYILGSARINFRDYIIFSTIGRTPIIIISSYFGESLEALKKYILLAGILTICISIIYFYRSKKLLNKKV